MKTAHREAGTIESIRTGDDDGRWTTTYIYIKLDAWGTQAFGGYVLNEHCEAWNAALCVLFGVEQLDQLVGKRCWVLRGFARATQDIEGLEAEDGRRRFTATDFWRSVLSKPIPSVLEKHRAQLQGDIRRCASDIEEKTRELAQLESDYVEWAQSP